MAFFAKLQEIPHASMANGISCMIEFFFVQTYGRASYFPVIG